MDSASADQQQEWHPAKSNYLFPVRALSRYFRGKMVSARWQASTQKALPHLSPADITPTLDTVMAKDRVVYSKTWLDNPDTVTRYPLPVTRDATPARSLLVSRDCVP